MRRNGSGRRRAVVTALVAAVSVVAVLALGVWWLAPNRYLPWDTAPFPDIDAAVLSPQQVTVVELLAREHAQQRPGTFYAEGVEEEWCADFVSWIMREAGAPLSNPHSGHWRIPGVYTLQEYYEQDGRFEPVGSGYRPDVGDVVLYENTAGFGQHTNIVADVDGDTVTTVGGNEFRKIRVHTLDWAGDSAIVGFGRLTP
ncbi:CHAP domain-containing protein [Rhodococcus chondri]|uniref:CHAP domain-containing protein n=1 Tax=Rhodococcus chondri TaxID=3065941 RepID=A0ABU7JXM7_9NOCA|nr:CHAP domain-containing protein [Rhodococcus sp. CC-R104]MEE2034774.1 CHAP domain-containing protein [Rhodococcus sp. CC-R104]